MTTAQACVRGLLLAAPLPEAPRWGRGVARFSPRFADRRPASTAGATHFTDSPQWWGVAPHVEHQVVEGLSTSFPLACHPSEPSVCSFLISAERVAASLNDLGHLQHDLVGEG